MSNEIDILKMYPKEYIEKRLEDQINWYDDKSNKARKKYKILQTFEIVFAAGVPLLSVYVLEHWIIKFVIALLGTLIVILASISRLGGYHENWLHYRSTCELLKHEKYLYLTGSTPYDGQPFNLLVERVESIISSENVNWSQIASFSNTNNKQ